MRQPTTKGGFRRSRSVSEGVWGTAVRRRRSHRVPVRRRRKAASRRVAVPEG
ncbi:hypothetical protein U2718_022460 [Chlorogloeopsis sp. ULAP02]